MSCFYLAYGKNLCERVMRDRCPDAIKVGPMRINRARLVFRDVADIVVDPETDQSVPGGLWWITEDCERFLDGFEGPGYRKLVWPEQTIRGRTAEIMLYQMKRRRGVWPPENQYFWAIEEGYKNFGYGKRDLKALAAAAEWARKNPQLTAEMHDRYVRRGRLPRVDLRRAKHRD